MRIKVATFGHRKHETWLVFLYTTNHLDQPKTGHKNYVDFLLMLCMLNVVIQYQSSLLRRGTNRNHVLFIDKK